VALSNIAPALETKAKWDERLSCLHLVGPGGQRRKHIDDHAWCILTEETAKRIGRYLQQFNSVIEVFAGTGYIASHLREHSGLGRKYRAYDPCRSHWRRTERPNYGFTRKGCFNVNLKKADCIVMTWPNYNDNLGYRVARKMVSGQRMIYQGEGTGGCTGCDKFHEYLDANFSRVQYCEELFDRDHVKWPGMWDSWWVYIKN
jgi:hypothetical protein